MYYNFHGQTDRQTDRVSERERETDENNRENHSIWMSLVYTVLKHILYFESCKFMKKYSDVSDLRLKMNF